MTDRRCHSVSDVMSYPTHAASLWRDTGGLQRSYWFEPTMSTIHSMRDIARAGAFLTLRGATRRMSPVVPNNRIEAAVRWLGFFEAPEPAEVIANYLRGYLLFGRKNPFGEWFHWYRLPARSVITRENAHVPRRQRPLLHRDDIEFRYNQDFELVIRHCQEGRD